MTVTELLLIMWIHSYSLQVGVDPNFAVAVATVECGPGPIRSGSLNKKGTYIGPFGLHKDFRKKWNIDDPKENCKRGVLALRGRDKIKVLKRYNPKADSRYIKAVMNKYRELRRSHHGQQ